MPQMTLTSRWTQMQHDPELDWIVQETVDHATSTRHSLRSVFEALSNVVAATLHEREPALAPLLTADDLYAMAVAHWRTKPDSWTQLPRHAQAADILPVWLAYAQMRLMGMPSPWARPARDAYWPFGQEGGFCNPRKLKMLAEDD